MKNACALQPDTIERDQLITQHLYLVRGIANRLHLQVPRHVEKNDLISAGMLGLIDAAARYQAERKTYFPVYARQRIRGAMLDYMRAQSWIPRAAYQKLRAEEPDTLRFRSSGVCIEGLDMAACTAPPDTDIAEHQLRAVMGGLVRLLPERDQAILLLHYLHQRTMRDISKDLNLSEGRISQLHNAALGKLKKMLEDKNIRSAECF